MLRTVVTSTLALVAVQPAETIGQIGMTGTAVQFALVLGSVLGVFKLLDWAMSRKAKNPYQNGFLETLKSITACMQRIEAATNASTTALALIQKQMEAVHSDLVDHDKSYDKIADNLREATAEIRSTVQRIEQRLVA